MERFLKQYDREYMKMAMLKHEETFREQVHELHRLYRIQKKLMRDVKNKGGRLERSRDDVVENKTISHRACYSYQAQRRPRGTLDLERPAEEFIDCSEDVTLEIERESEVELTLATGTSRRRKKEEASFTSDSGVSLSSSSTESGGENLKLHDQWGLLQMPDGNVSFPSERKSGFDVEGRIRQDRLNQPPWLYQCLSLNI